MTNEQKERAQACKTPEEMLALAKEEGFELSGEDLDAVVGGAGWFGFGKEKKETVPEATMKPMRFLGE